MGVSKRKCLRFLAFIVFPLLILGCSAEKEKVSNVAEDIKLNSGTVLKDEDGTYKVYNYENGKYELLNSKYIISSYDKESSTYIYAEDEKKHYIACNKQRFEIKDLNYSDLKLSKGGEYISYFIEDNGLKLKVFEANGNKAVEIKSNVTISGVLYDWYDNDTLIYYGVSHDGINGLFSYNIKEDKEELVYRIKEGYLAFLKGTDDNVVFLQLTLENQRQLMMIDKKTKDVKLLSSNIQEVSDIVISNNTLYFTGKVGNNTNSLYLLKDNKEKRLVYDFPISVKINKGLKVDENGNILFIGASGEDSSKEQVYMYEQNGSISAISKSSMDYIFVDYKG